MSNNPLQREYFPRVEEVNEEAARQAAGEAGERALSPRPQSPAPDPDPAAADVQMGGMDNDDMPAQGGAEGPSQGAEEQAQGGLHAPEAPRAEQGRGGHQRGNPQPRGQNRRRGPGDRRTSRSQAYWNRGRQGGYRGHHGGHRAQGTNISAANPADAAGLAQQRRGPRPNHPPRGRRDQRRGPRRGDRGRGQQ